MVAPFRKFYGNLSWLFLEALKAFDYFKNKQKVYMK